MARHRRARYSQRYRQPSLWNTLRFRISLLPLFNPLSRFPMSSRRNTVIRTVAALCGDIAVGVALATAYNAESPITRLVKALTAAHAD